MRGRRGDDKIEHVPRASERLKITITLTRAYLNFQHRLGADAQVADAVGLVQCLALVLHVDAVLRQTLPRRHHAAD